MIPAKMCEIRSVLGNGLVTNFLPKNPFSCTLPEGGEEIPDYGSMKRTFQIGLAEVQPSSKAGFLNNIQSLGTTNVYGLCLLIGISTSFNLISREGKRKMVVGTISQREEEI